MHALLFRKWKDRVKGRDWFDLEWYIKKNVPLHLKHFKIRSAQSGHGKEGVLDRHKFMELLKDKIKSVSFEQIRNDIVKFIPEENVLDIWSPSYFLDLIKNIKIEI